MSREGAARIDIGNVIERTVATTSAIARPLLLPALLLLGGSTFAFQYVSGYNPADPSALLSSPAYWLAVSATGLVGSFGQTVIVGAALDHLFGRRVDAGASFGRAIDLLLPALGFYLLSFLLIAGGLVLLIVPGIMLALALTVGMPAMLEERSGIIESISRSRALTSGSRWRILALIFIGSMIYGAAAALLGAPLALAGEESGVPRGLLLCIDAIVGTFGALLTGAFTAALYVELRLVKEGPRGPALRDIFE